VGTNKKPSITSDVNATEFMLLVMGVISFSSTAVWILSGISIRNESSDKLTYLTAGISALLILIIVLKFRIRSFFSN
jgi:hypothetical protein